MRPCHPRQHHGALNFAEATHLKCHAPWSHCRCRRGRRSHRRSHRRRTNHRARAPQPFGLGLFHTGVQVGGREYTFAGGGGVFDMTPQEAPGAKFREAIDMGAFEGSESKLASIIDELKPQVRLSPASHRLCHPRAPAISTNLEPTISPPSTTSRHQRRSHHPHRRRRPPQFKPDSYNILTKNCNHFSDALVRRLLAKPIPGYLNRLAMLGGCCGPCLPPSLGGTGANGPVGGPGGGGGSGGGGGGSGSVRGLSVPPIATEAFAGKGQSLGTSTSGSRWVRVHAPADRTKTQHS